MFLSTHVSKTGLKTVTFICTLHHHCCLWLFCFVCTFHNYIRALCFWLGQLLGLNLHNAYSCWISRLAVLTIHLHSHFALGFVLLGLRVTAFLPRLCSRPNSCSLPSLTCSTQAPGTSQLTVKWKRSRLRYFPNGILDMRIEEQDWPCTFIGIKTKRVDIQHYVHDTSPDTFFVHKISSLLFILWKTVGLRHSSRAFWDNARQNI